MRISHSKLVVATVVVAMLAPTLQGTIDARGFRRLRSIPRPNSGTSTAPSTAIPSALVERAVQRVIDAWNERDIGALWQAEKFDHSRVPELLLTDVPRDATLRVLAIEGVTIIAQGDVRPTASGQAQVSVVSVIVRTQLEYSDPRAGFARSEGVNELILAITEHIGADDDER